MLHLTFWNWLFVLGLFIFGLVVSGVISDFYVKGVKEALLKIFLPSLIVPLLTIFTINWYNTSTASGIRGYKDYQSELSNGLDREIIITAEDGREIFHYEGKIDIESNHEDNYIKFESEDHKRYIIYYGIQDTITIIEK